MIHCYTNNSHSIPGLSQLYINPAALQITRSSSLSKLGQASKIGLKISSSEPANR